jgi:CheY-like chemotaxis protein
MRTLSKWGQTVEMLNVEPGTPYCSWVALMTEISTALAGQRPPLASTVDRPFILVVEDDEDSRSAIADLLEETGYTVIAVVNGREALRVLREGVLPRGIVLDLMMPIMDGWDFRANQLKDPRLSTIPVVLMTAAGFSPETIQMQLHGVELVRKPLSADRLLTAVARVFLGVAA